MPFDFTGQKFSISLSDGYSTLRKAASRRSPPLFDRWDLGSAGQFGALIDLAHSTSKTRTDAFQVDPTSTSPPAAPSSWVPESASWRRVDFTNKRDGIYVGAAMEEGRLRISLTYFKSRYNQRMGRERDLHAGVTP